MYDIKLSSFLGDDAYQRMMDVDENGQPIGYVKASKQSDITITSCKQPPVNPTNPNRPSTDLEQKIVEFSEMVRKIRGRRRNLINDLQQRIGYIEMYLKSKLTN